MTNATEQSKAALPAEVRALTSRYLDAVDTAVPGLVERLYVVGSVALGAWQAGVSDIDTLIMTSRRMDADELAALAQIHAGMPSRPQVDGIYLDRDAFAARPTDGGVVPFVVNGEFRVDKPCGELNPVVWLILQRYGLPVRGPAVADLGVSVDFATLRQYNLDNLRAYWQPLADKVREQLRDTADDTPVDGDSVAWVVLGPARLHYTLAFNDVVAKPHTATYLRECFPAWADLADRATRWRAGVDVSFSAGDLRDAARGIDAIVDDAWSRYGGDVRVDQRTDLLR